MPDEKKELNNASGDNDVNTQNANGEKALVSVRANEGVLAVKIKKALADTADKINALSHILNIFAHALDDARTAINAVIAMRKVCVNDPAIRDTALAAAGELSAAVSAIPDAFDASRDSLINLAYAASIAADEADDVAARTLASDAADFAVNISALLSRNSAALAVSASKTALIDAAPDNKDIADAFNIAIRAITQVAVTLGAEPEENSLKEVKSSLMSKGLFAAQNNSAHAVEELDNDNEIIPSRQP